MPAGIWPLLVVTAVWAWWSASRAVSRRRMFQQVNSFLGRRP